MCIIVTYNGMTWIDSCLGSLRASGHPVHVVVIDNASADGTVDYIRKNFPEVLVIEAGANLGFGRANNMGLKMALKENVDYVFLLNQDAFLNPDCLSLLIKTSLVNKEFAVFSPFHLNYTGDAIEDYFGKYIISIEAPDYISDLYFANVQKIYPVTFVHAAGWLLPIDIVKKIGGFDPLFFHYGEDNDYLQRVIYYNYKVGFVPNAIMYHHGTNAGLMHPENLFSSKINFATINLKNLKANFTGALLIFLKGIFDGITSAILARDFKRIREQGKLAWSVSKTIRKIAKSRKVQSKTLAYLDS